jgi:nucleoside-diphosphate-sugar epimerase
LLINPLSKLDLQRKYLLSMKVLLAGAYGQVGQELIRALSARLPLQNIICADLREPPANVRVAVHETLNVLDRNQLYQLIEKHQVKQVYCLAALLSATGEKDPLRTEQINMTALFNCLEAAREGKIERLFWPSSIAAFGSNTPKRTPQLTVMEPNTVYGITKKSG